MEQKPVTITDIIKPELPTIEALMLINTIDQSNIQTMAIQELNYLEQHAALKPDIIQCIPSSIVLAVKNVIRKNLSLDPNAGLVYIKTRNQNIAPYGQKDHWVKVLEIQETANGLISYNRQIGRLLDFTNPIVKKNSNGKVISVSMKLLLPSYPEPRWEEREFDESDFKRWKSFSHKERAKGYKANDNTKPKPDAEAMNYANALYISWEGGLDPEFARAKCIKHSLKKLGSNPNEIANRIIQLPKSAPIIDPGIAIAEAEDDNITPHEEIDSHVNQNKADAFNADDI